MFPEALIADDLDTAARTVWGEARGEGPEGMLAVAHVIRNRAEKGGWWGDTLETVCKKKWQFSCWNPNDPNRQKLLDLDKKSDGYFQALSAVAMALVSDDDPTNGSCHYHTKGVKPAWSEGHDPAANIGNHLFFAGIK